MNKTIQTICAIVLIPMLILSPWITAVMFINDSDEGAAIASLVLIVVGIPAIAIFGTTVTFIAIWRNSNSVFFWSFAGYFIPAFIISLYEILMLTN
jgi:hypothetical protein